LVVGLGNPGPKYVLTRHNIGRRILEHLEAPPRGVSFLVPESFMNESGIEVVREARYKNIQAEEILVVSDDFELPLGRFRFRLSGSSGGHNGLQSILDAMGTNHVPRFRVGIGPVAENQDPADFVLEKFKRSDERIVKETIIPKAYDAVVDAMSKGIEYAMNKYNNITL